ncbi:Trypsin [Popillia japonica]|uniref:Trypsin n=1 Tax=Popillia japonica TaxID=7064 RepID=A0AAW1LWM4_POPJA
MPLSAVRERASKALSVSIAAVSRISNDVKKGKELQALRENIRERNRYELALIPLTAIRERVAAMANNKNSKHIVLLKTRKGEPFCSGSLLTTQHILTSGYCCRFHIFRNIIEVNAGFTKDNKIKQKAFAQKRYVHPTVNACVLELKTSIKFDEDIKISPVTTPSVFRKLLAKNVCRDSYAVGFILMDNTNEPGKQLLNQEACIEECPISLAECNDDKDALCNTLTDSKNCSNLTGGAAMCQGFQMYFFPYLARKLSALLHRDSGPHYINTDSF